MRDQTDSSGLGIAESMWTTSEAVRRLVMKPLSSCIDVLIPFSLPLPSSPLHPCLPHTPASSPYSSLFPFTSSPSHLNICLAFWWAPSCLTVSPMKRPTICSVVHITLGTAGTYGWEGERERKRLNRPDECLYLPPGTQTGLQFTHLRCQQCKPPTKVVFMTWKISK